ncbi:TetR-like C-terminal domain-containing protein [Patulibacter defluvii]|uniref:TetR-like C-terminal domain-containing protein n=1 Tax=Patulibacter defluvii TaxID=3095358 RepID=UPI002A75235D|nr:TetR-like C-terminal domain-containing protein [Patulibacter sp. DM4]
MEQPQTRPGGRTARVREAVLAATRDALAARGLDGIDLGAVAAAADVGKTTVYRRWGSATALVADLLDQMADRAGDRVDRGSLLADLEENAGRVQRTLADPQEGRLYAALVAAATCDERAAAALERFYERRVAVWAGCVEDAVARGEVPAGTDAAAVVRAVSAPLYYQRLTRGRPPAPADARRAAAAAVAAAAAGVFVRDGDG